MGLGAVLEEKLDNQDRALRHDWFCDQHTQMICLQFFLLYSAIGQSKTYQSSLIVNISYFLAFA